MAFSFAIECGAIEPTGTLTLRGVLITGWIRESDLMRMPAIEGVELVARVIFMKTFDGLPHSGWSRVGEPILLSVIPAFASQPFKAGTAEFTKFCNSAAMGDLIRTWLAHE